MGNEIFELKTNQKLIEALEKSLSRKPTANEIREQRISFVYGSLSSKSSVTRDKVRKLIDEQEGLAA